MRTLFTIVTLLLAYLTLPSAAATTTAALTLSNQTTPPALVQQRADFIAARNAIKQGQRSRYQQLAQGLKDYPLYPYLEFWDLNRNLSTVTSNEIKSFVHRYEELPLARRLQLHWLEKLAKQGRWQLLVDHYKSGNDTELECYYRRGLYKTGNKAAAFNGLEKLWLVGRSQPRACDPLFSAWQSAGHLTNGLAWQRTILAMENKQVYLARYLERFLSPEQAKWSKLWREIHRHPERIIDHPKLQQDIEIVRTILAYGVRRMTRTNPSKAAVRWDRLVMSFAFSEQEFTTTESKIALRLARKQAPEAQHWLGSINADNVQVRDWRILTALNLGKWEDVIFWYNQLPENEQQAKRWRYWLARAYEESGKPKRAKAIYGELAGSRNYYGFLAADRINSHYDFEHRPLDFNTDELAATGNLPGMLRTREFYMMDDMLYARREWYATVKELDSEGIQKVAMIVHQWGWHNGAIHSLGRARYLDDLEIRFPLVHRDQINNNTRKQQVDPSWAYAVIRQESAFASDARSPVGAMGLMQIMPNTGKLIARDLNTRLKSKNQLLDVNTNLRFGISYLRRVMNRFDDNTVLATAAYNAGPQRVKSWLPKDDEVSPDLWIENVPFKETRNYLKQVLAFSAIYDQRMQQPVTPLKVRMPIIEPAETPSL